MVGVTGSPVCERDRERTARTLSACFALGLLLALAFTLAGAGSALAITRGNVLVRAQKWIDSPVPYSQHKYVGGYRTDCSGYVSMCWHTSISWTTRTFHYVSHKITTAARQPGDARLKRGHHIILFYGWYDDAHTMYVAYEQTGPATKSSIKYIATALASGYLPYRYNHIAATAPSRNLLRNATFDVWAHVRSTTTIDPVWWTLSGGSSSQTLALRRQDVVKTGRNSAQLKNPNASATAYTKMSQTVTITPAATYTLSAWARTASDTGGLQLGIAYLDRSGGTITETHTTGVAWGVKASSFRKMAVTAAAPAGAVRAVVTVQLAGGTTTVATTTVSGTSAILDDMSLVRPKATIAIKRSASTVSRGKSVKISGSVTPKAAVGTSVVLYVKKPGSSSWARASRPAVYASGSTAAWKSTYTFKRSMAKGTYRFRAELPAFGDWLGSGMSSTVSVKVR